MGFSRVILHLLPFERPETATRPEHSDMDLKYPCTGAADAGKRLPLNRPAHVP